MVYLVRNGQSIDAFCDEQSLRNILELPPEADLPEGTKAVEDAAWTDAQGEAYLDENGEIVLGMSLDRRKDFLRRVLDSVFKTVCLFRLCPVPTDERIFFLLHIFTAHAPAEFTESLTKGYGQPLAIDPGFLSRFGYAWGRWWAIRDRISAAQTQEDLDAVDLSEEAFLEPSGGA